MKIYDEQKSKQLEFNECDFTKGYLLDDVIEINGKKESIMMFKQYSPKELLKIEIDSLKSWFQFEYRELFEKCIRRISLGVSMRDGSDPNEILKKLYKDAEDMADRITKLENELEKGE